MSSDDTIFISKRTSKVYYIQSQESFGEEDIIGQGKNLVEAVDIAIKWQEDHGMMVEYGIRFIR